ncbi:hypothetical protein BVY03_00100, partial [bacterium K02(2017)]
GNTIDKSKIFEAALAVGTKIKKIMDPEKLQEYAENVARNAMSGAKLLVTPENKEQGSFSIASLFQFDVQEEKQTKKNSTGFRLPNHREAMQSALSLAVGGRFGLAVELLAKPKEAHLNNEMTSQIASNTEKAPKSPEEALKLMGNLTGSNKGSFTGDFDADGLAHYNQSDDKVGRYQVVEDNENRRA